MSGTAAVAGRKTLGSISIALPTLWTATAMVLVCLLGGEVIGRAAVRHGWLTAPGIPGGHLQFDIKISLLEEFALNGPIDCIFVGNSMTGHAIDPDVIAEVYRRKSRRDLRCFNFGVQGASGPTIAAVAEILASDFHPKLIVFGTSPVDLIPQMSPIQLSKTPWFQYRLGHFSVTGWLTDRSFLYRWIAHAGSWISESYWPRMAQVARLRRGFRANGVRVVHGGRLKPNDNFCGAPAASMAKNAPPILARYARLRDHGTAILAVEVPFHHDLHSCFRAPDSYEQTMRSIAQDASRIGLPFRRSLPISRLPQRGWVDLGHMNNVGSEAFSAWLGTRIATDLDRLLPVDPIVTPGALPIAS